MEIRNNPRVLVLANDPLARAGLATMLADQPECTVVGQASGDDDVPETLEVYRPDVLVWDLGWDPATALERLADLQETDPPIVALLPDEAQALEAWAAGARGVLLRDTDAPRLLATVTAVSQGMVVLDPSLATAVLPETGQMPGRPREELTPRELEVLRLLAEGLPNKTIAHRLGVSEHTVKFHVNSILSELGAHSRTEAVINATRLGLILL